MYESNTFICDRGIEISKATPYKSETFDIKMSKDLISPDITVIF